MADVENNPLYISLRDHFETRLNSITDTMKATDKAIDLRLAAMNELRDQINNERGRYLLRDEFNIVSTRMEKDIKDLQLSRAELSGKASMSTVFWTAAIAVLGVATSIAGLAMQLLRN